MAKKIAVVQSEKEPVPLEILATSIRAIAAGIKNIRKGPLGENALLLLIQNNCLIKKTKHSYPTKCKLSLAQIKSVLDSVESLQSAYLK